MITIWWKLIWFYQGFLKTVLIDGGRPTYLNLLPNFKTFNHVILKLSILWYIMYSVSRRDIDLIDLSLSQDTNFE